MKRRDLYVRDRRKRKGENAKLRLLQQLRQKGERKRKLLNSKDKRKHN